MIKSEDLVRFAWEDWWSGKAMGKRVTDRTDMRGGPQWLPHSIERLNDDGADLAGKTTAGNVECMCYKIDSREHGRTDNRWWYIDFFRKNRLGDREKRA